MTDSQYDRADSGGVWNVALAAVMLIVAGLGLMAWDESSYAAAPASAFHHR